MGERVGMRGEGGRGRVEREGEVEGREGEREKRKGQVQWVIVPCRYVHNELSAMTHFNGTPVSVLYCDGDFTDPATQGGIVNFNLLRPNGKFVGYSEVSLYRGFCLPLSVA